MDVKTRFTIDKREGQEYITFGDLRRIVTLADEFGTSDVAEVFVDGGKFDLIEVEVVE